MHRIGALSDDGYVICPDEKPSFSGAHATEPPRPAQPMRVEHEYARAGALAYLAAWDARHARIFGRCEPKTGITSFDRFVDEVMNRDPYASARHVF